MGTRTGEELLESMRDGRQLFIDGYRVEDVTTDPRFGAAARSLAQLYDMQHNPALTRFLRTALGIDRSAPGRRAAIRSPPGQTRHPRASFPGDLVRRVARGGRCRKNAASAAAAARAGGYCDRVLFAPAESQGAMSTNLTGNRRISMIISPRGHAQASYAWS
jgi:hypothetical protein